MGYEINENLISSNRPGSPLNPQGAVLHNTDNMGDTALANRNYFNTQAAEASAHYIADAETIIQCIPGNEVAWHAGPTANRMYWGVELCTTADAVKFNEIWKRGVWLFAQLFKSEAIYSVNFGNLRSHAEVATEWKETDHTDPVAYLASFGVTMDNFRAAVQTAINTGKIHDLIQAGIIQMNLQLGDNNQLVAALQTDLNTLGYNMTVDSNFGESTELAVQNFQAQHNLSVDGIVGQATNDAIYVAKKSNSTGVSIPDYKIQGAQFMKDAGLTTDLHNPLDLVDIGTLGTIFKNAFGKLHT